MRIYETACVYSVNACMHEKEREERRGREKEDRKKEMHVCFFVCSYLTVSTSIYCVCDREYLYVLCARVCQRERERKRGRKKGKSETDNVHTFLCCVYTYVTENTCMCERTRKERVSKTDSICVHMHICGNEYVYAQVCACMYACVGVCVCVNVSG